jgi:hypothetical protein
MIGPAGFARIIAKRVGMSFPNQSMRPRPGSERSASSGNALKCPTFEVVTSVPTTPRIQPPRPSAWIAGPKSPSASCSVDTGSSTPSAASAATLASKVSDESLEPIAWRWVSLAIQPRVSTTRVSVASIRSASPASSV